MKYVKNQQPSMPIPAQELHLMSGEEVPYYLYLPGNINETTSIFVAIHGYKRNVEDHAKSFAPYAEKHGFVLVAPLFSKKKFRDYQRLGRNGNGSRADFALKRIISRVISIVGIENRKLSLFGYSGGGQFVHRYAMAYPSDVFKAVIAAAGWYTFPDPATEYPFGIKRSARLQDINFSPSCFLSVPMCILVGEHDNIRDQDFRQSPFLDQNQGITRIERGRRWAKVMAAAARSYNMHTAYRFKMLPKAGHSFFECMQQGEMAKHTFEFLLDRPDKDHTMNNLKSVSGRFR